MRKSHWETGKKGTFDATDADRIDSELCLRCQAGDRKAQDKLIKRHIGLIFKAANSVHELGIIDRDDLISLAMAGILEASKRFKPGDNKLTTYAVWWMRAETNKAKTNFGRLIRIPGNIISETGKAKRTKEAKRTPKQKALIEEAEALKPWSIDVPLNSRSDNWAKTLKDALPDHEATAPDTAIDASNLSDTVADMLLHLSPKQREVITKRFGLGTDTPRTLREVADDLGISRERVRQIEVKALGILRVYRARLAEFA